MIMRMCQLFWRGAYFEWSTNTTFVFLQALFRKIAAALPGMESLSAAKQEDLVDVNLSATANNGRGAASSAPSSCAC